MANGLGDAICSGIIGCQGAKAIVGEGAKAVASNGFQQAATTIFGGYDDIMKQFLTSWVGAGFLVDLDNKATSWFQDTSLPITIALLVLGLVVAGARTMFAQRGEPFQEAMRGLARVVFVTTAGTAFVQIMVWGGDAYADWILKVSGTTATAGFVDVGFATSSPGLALIFGLLGILSVALQWVIMFVRQAMLLLLNTYWPMTASYAMLRQGQSAFEKVTAWIIAFIIYSPLAASIYAFAWRLKNGQDGAGGVLYGLMLIILAVVALPAIMRLIAPATAALGSAVGGAMALGMTAAAVSAGVAVGAAVATGGTSAGAGAGAGKAATTETAASTAEGSDMASSAAEPDSGSGGGGDLGSVAGGGGGGDAGGMVGGDSGASSDVSSATDTGAGASGSADAGMAGADGADADSGSSSSGATASGASDSSSGQSATSRGAWAAAGHAADNAPSDARTAEGMIGE